MVFDETKCVTSEIDKDLCSHDGSQACHNVHDCFHEAVLSKAAGFVAIFNHNYDFSICKFYSQVSCSDNTVATNAGEKAKRDDNNRLVFVLRPLAPPPAEHPSDQLAVLQTIPLEANEKSERQLDCFDDSICGTGSRIHYYDHFQLEKQQSRGAFQTRIFRGNLAVEGEFPFAVRLSAQDSSICGGTLIDRQWILTAAHCLFKANSFEMYKNLDDISIGANDPNLSEAIHLKMKLKRNKNVFVHPKYRRIQSKSFDFALIKLGWFPIFFYFLNFDFKNCLFRAWRHQVLQ